MGVFSHACRQRVEVITRAVVGVHVHPRGRLLAALHESGTWPTSSALQRNCPLSGSQADSLRRADPLRQFNDPFRNSARAARQSGKRTFA